MATTPATTARPANKALPAWMGFVNGGLAGMGATCFVQPIDVVKTRMQLSGQGVAKRVHATAFHAVKHIVKEEGLSVLYTGLSAGLLRQATYTTGRMGFYSVYKDWAQSPGESQLPFWKLLICGGFAGASGSLIAVPTEVALIRMQGDGSLPVNQRRNYKHVGDALMRIGREEGLAGLWKGAAPTVSRAAVLNMAQLSTYDQYKKMLANWGFGAVTQFSVQFAAAFMSGVTCTIVSMPLDIAKTRMQSQVAQADGKMMYTGTIQCIAKVASNEGVTALWKGFTPYWLRLGNHTVITFLILEQLTAFAKKNW